MADLEPGRLFVWDRPAQGTPSISQEMRNILTALARSNFTTDPAYPVAPRPGMVRLLAADLNNVKFEVALEVAGAVVWRTIFQKMHLGIPAPAKLIVRVNVPAAVWTIDHNLGSQPLVQVFDSAWRQRQVVPVGPGANQYLLQHATENRVVVTHPGAVDGYVVIVG